MAAIKMFPFTIRSCRNSGWVPAKLLDAWMAEKPKDLTWYGLDVTIHSPTEVEFVTYEMRCNIYGGIGAEKYRQKSTVSDRVTREFIAQRALHVAEARLQAEEEAARCAKVSIYVREILGPMGYL